MMSMVLVPYYSGLGHIEQMASSAATEDVRSAETDMTVNGIDQ